MDCCELSYLKTEIPYLYGYESKGFLYYITIDGSLLKIVSYIGTGGGNCVKHVCFSKKVIRQKAVFVCELQIACFYIVISCEYLSSNESSFR